MNKKEFLDIMEKRLSVLDAQEREDMLSEYAQHIELKMESGMSEKEAIDDFGDIDSLISEIFEVYHIDPSYKDAQKKNSDGIGKKASGVLSKSKQSFSDFMEQQKEKQEKRMEQKRKEDREKPSRWAMAANKTKADQNAENMAKTAGRKTMDMIKVIIILCVKAILLLIALPSIAMALFSLFGFGLLVILLLEGYPLVGATLAMFGCILGFGAFAFLVMTFVIEKWTKSGRKDVEA